MKTSEMIWQERVIGILENNKPIKCMVVVNNPSSTEEKEIAIKKKELTERGFVFKK
jgi:hypothetical protein